MANFNLEFINFNLEFINLLLVFRYKCKNFPISLLYVKIPVQAKLLQNINYYARNKEQDNTGFT